MNTVIELCLNCNGDWNQKYQSIGKAQLSILNEYMKLVGLELAEDDYRRNISQKIIAKIKSANNLLDSIEQEEEN